MNVNKNKNKTKIIDFKIDEYCVDLPTRNCVEAYERLAFFGGDVEGTDIYSVGVATVIVRIAESTAVTNVELMS